VRSLIGFVALAALGLTGCGRTPSGDDGAARSPASTLPPAASRAAQRLQNTTERYYDQYLALHPFAASAQGDHRFDDRFGDYVSPSWMADSLAIEQEALEAVTRIDPAKLTGEDLITLEAFMLGREIAIEGFRYESELLPVSQDSGLHAYFAVQGSGRGVHSFRTAEDYDKFLRRMDGFVEWVDQSVNNMRAGVAKGIVQPRVVVERTIPQVAALIADDPKQSVFWQPILNFPAGIDVADRRRLIAAYEEKLSGSVLPAYRRLHDYLKNEYLQAARETVGWSELPSGAVWYAYLVRLHTGTSMTADEVHELGLAEVTRIRGAMERLRRQLGQGPDLATFFAVLRSDRLQYYRDPADLLAGYRVLQARVDAAMPLLFARMPRAGFEVRAVEPYRAGALPSVAYEPASADGTRPGVLYVNTTDLPSRPKYAMEAIYLHEAVPGHHYQISLAQEATELPRFRRFAKDAAYAEGWALYAESLGRDLGFYTDAYSAFGALSLEMWRAARLVVDTGLHSKGWSRAKAIDYLRAHTALGEAEIAAEVDRCVASPGQALAYKVGELRFAELRRRAQEELGPRFDVRAFHSQVVESGSLPLAVLEKKIDRWIESQR
jgi:uncharacterized protein (DUF885 family)